MTLILSPTATLNTSSNTTSEIPTEIYDTDIQLKGLEKGIYLANTLKGKLRRT